MGLFWVNVIGTWEVEADTAEDARQVLIDKLEFPPAVAVIEGDIKIDAEEIEEE